MTSSKKQISFMELSRFVEDAKDVRRWSSSVTEAFFTELSKLVSLSFAGIFVVGREDGVIKFESLRAYQKFNKVSRQVFDQIVTKLTNPHTVLDKLTAERELVVLSNINNDVQIHLWDKQTAFEAGFGNILLNVFEAKDYYGVVAISLDKKLTHPKEQLPILGAYATLAEMYIRNFYLERENKGAVEGVAGKLRDFEREKEEFLSMVAHELRAPTTAMKGYLSMVIQGDGGDIPEKARGFLVDVTNENDRVIRLVNNMLNVSRIEENKMAYQLENESLARVARTVHSQFLPEAERKKLSFTLLIPADLKDRVLVDPDRIYEVISNLVSNAVKYTVQGKVAIELSNPKSRTVRLQVVDTGPGISKEEQAKLFTKFHRAESNVGKTMGTGLGLYISKLLIEKFKGKVDLNSKVGKGSTFWFELPLEEAKAS